MEEMSALLEKHQAKVQLEKSATKEQPTWSCRKCQDNGVDVGFGIGQRTVWSEQWGTMPAFCDCEKGREARKAFIELPSSQEHFKTWKMEKIEKMLKKSGVAERFRTKRLSDLTDSPALLKLCNSFVDNWEKAKKEGWGLYLWGNVGTGKTHTATAIANELIERHFVTVMFVSIADVAARVRKTFDSNQKDQDETLWEDMKKAELLVLDDFGMEKPTDWLKEQLFLVVNERYERQMPIIATSNQSLEDIAKAHFPQVASRLVEMCKAVRFAGEDRRKNLRPDF